MSGIETIMTEVASKNLHTKVLRRDHRRKRRLKDEVWGLMGKSFIWPNQVGKLPLGNSKRNR